MHGWKGSCVGRRDGILRTNRSLGKGSDAKLWITSRLLRPVEEQTTIWQRRRDCTLGKRAMSVGSSGDTWTCGDLLFGPDSSQPLNMPTRYNSMGEKYTTNRDGFLDWRATRAAQ